MGFIESLNKCGEKIPLQKTKIYLDIQEEKLSLEALGLSLKIKSDFDLFEYEIIYHGLKTQNYIENAYEIFLNQNYDLLDYLNYDEKQKMFNNDISSFLNQAPCFIKDDVKIYIPFFESFLNKRYTQDFQMLMLKQHREYIKNLKIQQNTPIQMYGIQIFRTNFTSLKNVYEDDRHICLYYDALKKIYIFKKEDSTLLNTMIIQDHSYQGEISLDTVKKIAYDIENYLYRECLELLKEENLICQKTYKKVLKKYR